jgi:hypothetical protein
LEDELKTIINTYMSVDGLKEIRTSSIGDNPNLLDRVALSDTIGSVLQLDAGIVYKCLAALSAARNLTIDQYLANFKHTLEN